ncbi:signal peptide-containing protein [Theileria equi strain WA]|uniref:Signal peptide-containing protein n=1 Tax=Theileria equi strain WA TaxID=1537102 RepID=L0AWD1_THEEQ|nr:signal peptide-containing protein [Theileria equi strain WA]AFZ79855.1 signal peptide-containing protein [Theileria equi strain WA]|eukprot:XP_004829521.1 signal peptide-containing protein [Theileria equi strain WA]
MGGLTEKMKLLALPLLLSVCSLWAAQEESLANNLITDEQERFTLYKLTLVNVPDSVNAEDFNVDLIGTQFLLVKVANTTIEWRIRLHQDIPGDILFYPEYNAVVESCDKDVLDWVVTIRIPKYYELSPITYKVKTEL